MQPESIQNKKSGIPVASLAFYSKGIRFSLPDSSSVSRTRQILGIGAPYIYPALTASIQVKLAYPSSEEPLPNKRSPLITGSVGFVSHPSPYGYLSRCP